MKKNISSLLQRGNIRPKDRVLLLVADEVSQEQKGKSLLTDADRHALSKGWIPKNNEEVKEYNLYREGKRNMVFGELDAQTIYLNATNNFLRAGKCISYILFKNRFTKDTKTIKETISNGVIDTFLNKCAFNTIKDTVNNEALNLVLGYLGLELDYTIYLHAFELAGKELQADLLALYPDARTDRRYLEQEEIIFNLFDGKEKLTQEAKEKLAELIADECKCKYSDDEWSFSGYYADIPLLEVAKKTADNCKITYKEDSEELEEELTTKLTNYAKKKKTTIKELLTETILAELDNTKGGLLQAYIPLFMSEGKATCNEQDTKLTHKELFKKWLEVKAEATKTIQELIDKGELKTEKRNRKFKNIKKFLSRIVGITDRAGQDDITKKETKTIITGESLYNFKGDFNFVKDLRKQAEDFKILGALVLFLRNCRFVKDYALLLGFLELYKKLSNIYKIDLTYKIRDYINRFEKDLELLKFEFFMLGDDIMEANYKGDQVYYLNESFIEDLLTMPLASVKPDTNDELKVYFDAFEKLFGDDF